MLGLEPGAGDKEITKSYRRLALKTHPDKNPGDQDAAKKFHQLSLAYEALQKPETREGVEKEWRGQEEERRRRGKFEQGRKDMAHELERRESEFRKKSQDEEDEMRKIQIEVEKLKAEGLKMRRMYEDRINARPHATVPPTSDTTRPDPSTSLDSTLKIRLHNGMPRERVLSIINGLVPVESVVLNEKGTKGMVKLETIQAANHLMAMRSTREELRLIDFSWASHSQKEDDPGRKKRRFVFESPVSSEMPTVRTSSFEDDVLAKMRKRQAEKRMQV